MSIENNKLEFKLEQKSGAVFSVSVHRDYINEELLEYRGSFYQRIHQCYYVEVSPLFLG